MLEKILKYTLIGTGIGLLLITILPFLLLSKYIHIQADDFTVSAVLDKFGFFQSQIEWYRSWTGRYFALFIISLLHPIKFGFPEGIRLFSFLWICLFVLATWFFTRSFTDKKASIFVTALLVSAYCWQMPSTAEAFFWIPSTMSYQLGIGLQLVFFGLLNANNKNKFHKFILCILAISIPGTSEVNLLVFICILSVIVFLQLKRTTVNNTKLIFQLFALAIVASIFSIISPGNSVRTEVLTENAKNLPVGDLFYAIKGGLIATKKELFMLFVRTPLLLFSLLLVLLKPWHKILDHVKVPAWQLALFWLATFTVFVALHVPFTYKTGVITNPGRATNVMMMFYIVTWFIGVLITANYLKIDSGLNNVRMAIASVLVIILFSVLQLAVPNRIEHAWVDLLSGTANSYHTTLLKREAFVASAQGRSVQVDSLAVIPSSIFIDDINHDSLNWKNKAVANYYRLKSISTGSGNVIIDN
ncbi:MAG: hypothetical protein K1X77_11270 [Bacteroidia bacterium]|nr:hypothetical protein [Bacteroidia bacterium]